MPCFAIRTHFVTYMVWLRTSNVATSWLGFGKDYGGVGNNRQLKWNLCKSNLLLHSSAFHFFVVTLYVYKTNPAVSYWLTAGLSLPLRRERDSNPRKYDLQRFSRPPQSTTLPSLRKICRSATGTFLPPLGGLSGVTEIRTRETLLTFTRFPGVPLQPLEHHSKNICSRTFAFATAKLMIFFVSAK